MQTRMSKYQSQTLNQSHFHTAGTFLSTVSITLDHSSPATSFVLLSAGKNLTMSNLIRGEPSHYRATPASIRQFFQVEIVMIRSRNG